MGAGCTLGAPRLKKLASTIAMAREAAGVRCCLTHNECFDGFRLTTLLRTGAQPFLTAWFDRRGSRCMDELC
jgi:hypothetical protein